MARSRVVDVDRGYARVLRTLQHLHGGGVYVGIRQEKGSEVEEGDDLNLAQIAAVNEFGSSDGHVPERSFLRSTVDENKERYFSQMVKDLGSTVDGDVMFSEQQVLKRMGLRAVADVQKKITELQDPPNAPSTIKRKGSSNPLIDTGRMRQSIDYEIRTGPQEDVVSEEG